MGAVKQAAGRILASVVRSASAEPKEKIGFIGLGEMGSRMVRNLLSLESQEVVVCDDRGQALHDAQRLGAETVSTPAALASTEGVSVVFSMLPTTDVVRDVYTGSNGIIRAEGGVRPSLFVDCSTIDPLASRQVAEDVMQANLHHDSRPFQDCSAAHPSMIDAPVSGGITAAAAGTLTFMVGGRREAARAAEPYLKMLGNHVLYCGQQGNGQVAKVANNLALGIQMASICEAMAFGNQMGLDPKILAGIMNMSSARCWSSADYNPVPGISEGVPASRDYKGGFRLALMVKDLQTALSASQAVPGAMLPMTQRALELYTQAAESNPDQDFGSLFRHVYKDGQAS